MQRGWSEFSAAASELKQGDVLAAVKRFTVKREQAFEGRLIRLWYRAPFLVIPRPPLNDIRDYCGVEIAIYFAFLNHVTSQMLIPGTIGILPMMGWVYYGDMDNWLGSVFAVLILFWYFFFVKYWRRTNNSWNYRWNSAGGSNCSMMIATNSTSARAAPCALHGAHGVQASKSENGVYTNDDFLWERRRPKHKDGSQEDPRFDREIRRWHMMLSWLLLGLYLLFSFLVTIVALSLRVF